jgi:hypothetical protein
VRRLQVRIVTTHTFVSVPVLGLAVDAGARTIDGVVVPYGKVAEQSGARFRFAQGAVRWGDVGRVKLLRDHDVTRPIGKATALVDSAPGVRARFSVARGAAGDEALELAATRRTAACCWCGVPTCARCR